MATQFPETIQVPLVDPVATEINQIFDRLILSLQLRRVRLLTDLRDTREEMRHNRVALQQMEEQLVESRRMLEELMTLNDLHSIQERMVAELEAKRAELQANAPPPQEVRFLCNTRDLEDHIARLGEISCNPLPPTTSSPVVSPISLARDFAAFLQPIVVAGEQGSAPGEFDNARGVTIDQQSGNILVADMLNSRIQIFSQTGDYINNFSHQHLVNPWGILSHQDNVYVTDWKLHSIFLFKLSELGMLKTVGKQGHGKEEFNSPRQLALSPGNNICVADKNNHRLQILSTDLDFQGSLRHQTMTEPVDVKFKNNEIFVLSLIDNPCIHVFSLSGEKSRSLVTRGGYGMQDIKGYFFCIDTLSNIIMSDWAEDNIKIFSPEGDLLHTIGRYGHQAGTFAYPNGVTICEDKLICVSHNNNNALQIFSVNLSI